MDHFSFVKSIKTDLNNRPCVFSVVNGDLSRGQLQCLGPTSVSYDSSPTL